MKNLLSAFKDVKNHSTESSDLDDKPTRSMQPGRFYSRFTPEYEHEIQEIRKIDERVNKRLLAFITAEP